MRLLGLARNEPKTSAGGGSNDPDLHARNGRKIILMYWKLEAGMNELFFLSQVVGGYGQRGLPD